ncbi:MAG TPA: NAD(P)-binding protein [Marinobacter sp.]|nr:NAD(P)-binding protein [Marinobacter sp.]
MAMGVTIGHVTDQALGLVTLVGLITIAASTYMITYSHQIYDRMEPLLGIFDRRMAATPREDAPSNAQGHDVILFGLGRYGLGIAGELRKAGLKVLGVDFSPEAIRYARKDGYDAIFGDATDPEFLAHLPLGAAKWLVLAVPEHETGLTHSDPRRALLRSVRDFGFEGRVAVAAHREQTAVELVRAEADIVLMPYRDAAVAAARLILSGEATTDIPMEDPAGQKKLSAH